jgi:hypothetical protein
LSENEFSALFIDGNIFRLLFLLFTQLIPKLFSNCSVEEDVVVASDGISGQDEGFLDESATVDSPEPRSVQPGAFGDQRHRGRESKKEVPRFLLGYWVR